MTVTINGNKITATKDELNYISILANEAAKSFEKRGRDSLAKQANKYSDAIYEALKNINFYD